METQSDKSNASEVKSKNPFGLLSEERELPLMPVGDKQYKIDIANGELRSVEDPLRTISFHAMIREGNRFSFLYDFEKDKIVLEKEQPVDLKGKQWIQLPSLPKLDPKFNKKIEKEEAEVMVRIQKGTSVYNTSGLLPPEGSGPLLPIVNFYGTDFFLDLRLKEFREVANPHNSIPWKALQLEDFHFTLFYDTNTKNTYNGTSSLSKEPNVKFLFLPPVDIMISEGVKRHQQLLEAKQSNDKTFHIKVSKKRNFKR